MAVDEARRQHYLQTMGIQLWTLRDKVEAAGDADAEWADVSVTDVGTSVIPVELAPDRVRGNAGIQSPGTARRPHPAEQGEGGVGRGKPSRDPDTWRVLQEEVAACTACPLHATRTHAVFGSGNPEAEWMVIGEAPGEQEDLQGKPFVGRAGQLLTEMLRAIGLDRDRDVFIANILKSRPPGNRDPNPEEVAACEPFLKRQIEWIKPKIILSVGRVSAQNLLKTDTPIGKLRGKVHHYQGIPLVVTYHPAYLLRSPLEKRKAWDDLCLARRAFAGAES